MRKMLAALGAVLLTVGAGLMLATPASATETVPVNEGVCAPLDSGKIDVDGSVKTVTVTAPEGYLVSGYCVKAGSIIQGDGPEYVEVDPPVASVTFGHSTGKDISHYSATFVKKPTPTPTPTTTSPTPTPTDTGTSTPTPTPTETTATPTPTDTGSVPPTPTDTGSVPPSSTPPAPAPPTLADTGAPVGLVAAAGTLLASGAGLLLAARRKPGLHE